MNPAPTELPPATRVTEVAPKLSVTILYECLDTGKQAKRFTEQLADEEAANRALDLNLWSFRVLGMREIRNDSVGAAAAADLVILSMSGKNPLPAQVEKWIEMWTWLIDGHKPAVVALFSTPDTSGGDIRAYLRRAAVSKGLKFFPQTVCAGGNKHRNETLAEQGSGVDHRRRPQSHGDTAGSNGNRESVMTTHTIS